MNPPLKDDVRKETEMEPDMENAHKHMTNETNEVTLLRDEIVKMKLDMEEMKKKVICMKLDMEEMKKKVICMETMVKDIERRLRTMETMVKDIERRLRTMEARVNDMEGMSRNKAERWPRTDSSDQLLNSPRYAKYKLQSLRAMVKEVKRKNLKKCYFDFIPTLAEMNIVGKNIQNVKVLYNAESSPEMPRISFLRRSKPKPELCIYGSTDRESEFVRAFKKLKKKSYTFVNWEDLTDQVPIALVCECTQDRNANDLNRCLAIITESQYDRTTIIYIHEVTSSQQRPDKFTTRGRIMMTEEGHTYKEMDYRILDMLFAKDGLLTCKTNKDARKEIKTFVKEFTAKVEKRKKWDN